MSQLPSSSQPSGTILQRAQYAQQRLLTLKLRDVIGVAAEKAAARDWVEEFGSGMVRGGFFSFSPC